MISTTRYLAALATWVLSASVALAQGSFTSPHLLEAPDGAFLGIGWDLKGGQPAVRPGPRATHSMASLRMLLSPYGNPGVMHWLASNMDDGTPVRAVMNTFTLRKSGVVTGVAYEGMLPEEIVFPACDADSKDPAGIWVSSSSDGRMKIPVPDEVKRRAAESVAKKQKCWLPSNFRLRMGDLPCSRVNKIEALVVKQAIADLDGDGAPDYFYMPEELAFTVPLVEAGPFEEGLQAALNDKPIEYPVSLDYLDEDGNVLFNLSWTTFISSVGPLDPYGDPADPGALCQVRSKGRTYHKIQIKVVNG